MGKNWTPHELLQKAHWVQLDVLGGAAANQAVGVIMMKKPEFHKDEIRYLHNYIGSHFLGQAKAAEYRNEWVCVRIGDVTGLQNKVPDLEKFKSLSELFEKATWGTPVTGKRTAYFKHHKDALAYAEAFRWITNSRYDEGVVQSTHLKSKNSGLQEDLHTVTVPENNLRECFKSKKIQWEECGPDKYNLCKFFDKAKDWYPAGLESCRTRSAKERQQSTLSIKPEDNVSIRFGKSIDLDHLKKVIKTFTGEDVFMNAENREITLTVENRRRLELYLPERVRLPYGPLALHTNDAHNSR